MKTKHWIIIVASVLLAASIGGFIYGRYSIRQHPTKYVTALRGELDASLESNRQLAEYYSRIEEENRRARESIEQSIGLVDGIGNDVKEFENGIVITRKLVEECLELVRKLREIYSETEEG